MQTGTRPSGKEVLVLKETKPLKECFIPSTMQLAKCAIAYPKHRKYDDKHGEAGVTPNMYNNLAESNTLNNIRYCYHSGATTEQVMKYCHWDKYLAREVMMEMSLLGVIKNPSLITGYQPRS